MEFPSTVTLPLCLTVGDPTGIGPEITMKALRAPALNKQPLVVIGHMGSLEEAAKRLKFQIPETSKTRQFIHIPGDIQREPGAIAYMALNKAVEIIRQGIASGLVTGPISKENLWRSKIPYSGHTEILKALAESYFKSTYHPDMLFLFQRFRMLLLTRHVPLSDVSRSLTMEGVCGSFHNLVTFLQQDEGIAVPSICLLGANPHGGEIGGEEEKSILIPARSHIQSGCEVKITPPLPADGVFRGFSLKRNSYDAFVAAYHDQGLIPFKLIAGLRAVNVTIGLPFLRTSVSHGVAMDIAGRGVADPISLLAALETMIRLQGVRTKRKRVKEGQVALVSSSNSMKSL